MDSAFKDGHAEVNGQRLHRLIIVHGAHPFISERELRENPAQRYASNYFFVFNNFLAPGEQPPNENDTKERATPKPIDGCGSTRGHSLDRQRPA